MFSRPKAKGSTKVTNRTGLTDLTGQGIVPSLLCLIADREFLTDRTGLTDLIGS